MTDCIISKYIASNGSIIVVVDYIFKKLVFILLFFSIFVIILDSQIYFFKAVIQISRREKLDKQ